MADRPILFRLLKGPLAGNGIGPFRNTLVGQATVAISLLEISPVVVPFVRRAALAVGFGLVIGRVPILESRTAVPPTVVRVPQKVVRVAPIVGRGPHWNSTVVDATVVRVPRKVVLVAPIVGRGPHWNSTVVDATVVRLFRTGATPRIIVGKGIVPAAIVVVTRFAANPVVVAPRLASVRVVPVVGRSTVPAQQDATEYAVFPLVVSSPTISARIALPIVGWHRIFMPDVLGETLGGSGQVLHHGSGGSVGSAAHLFDYLNPPKAKPKKVQWNTRKNRWEINGRDALAVAQESGDLNLLLAFLGWEMMSDD